MQWQPDLYLQFEAERKQPAQDLVARLQRWLPAGAVRRAMDLGCGPGNSTALVAAAWPGAEVIGLDSSDTMLAAARQALPGLRFIEGDLAQWASDDGPSYDLVFSNSAVQWVNDHATLLPRLLRRVAPGGALGMQVPAGWDAAVCAVPRQLAAAPEWRRWLGGDTVRHWGCESLAFYHDVLAPVAQRLELWETEYVMVLPGAEAILAWYQGSGLRPFLAALPDEAARERFQQEYLAGLRRAYPPRPNGRVLFPFRRRFVVALLDRGVP